MFIEQKLRDIKWRKKHFPKLKPRISKVHKAFRDRVIINTEYCTECKGSCCRTTACAFSPADFEKISFNYLKERIEKSGYICIKYIPEEFSGQGTGVFYLAVRNRGADIVDIPERNRGGCSLITDTGCPFSYEQRPTGGKLVLPIKSESQYGKLTFCCKQFYDAKELCYEWLPYKKILQRLAYKFCGEYSGVPDT